MKARILLILVLFTSALSWAQPCKDGWGYRVPIIIDNTINPDPLVDYQLKFVINTDSLIQLGQLKSDASDLRFTNAAGVDLPFWIENNTLNTNAANVWVNVDNIPPLSTIDVYMFYHNESAVSAIDGDATFLHYDNFDGTALDFGKWTFCGGPGGGTIPVVSGGVVTMESNSTIYNHSIKSFQTFQGPITTEMSVVSASTGTTVLAQTANTDDGYGMAFEEIGNIEYMRLVSTNNEPMPDLCLETQNQSPLSNVPAGSFSGLWSFTWSLPNEQLFSWPGGNEIRTDFFDSMYFQEDKNVVVGSFNNTGSVSIDYIYTRKYSPIVPTYTFNDVTDLVDIVEATTNATICAGDTLKLFSPSFQGAVYSWVGPNGFTSNDQNPVFPAINTLHVGTWVVTVSAPTNCSAKSDSVEVTMDAVPDGGTLLIDQTVCEAIDAGSINVNNYIGNIVYWESSNTEFGPWNTITSTEDTIDFNNLVADQYYRVIVESGVCGLDTSNTVAISVDPTTVGGVLVGGDLEKCEADNNGVLTLTGLDGAIEFWQSSTDNGLTWDTIPSNSNQHTFLNLDTTTWYRVLVKSGVCPSRFSDTTEIIVHPLPEVLFEFDTVCFGHITTFTNLTTVTEGGIETYSWNFGDGSNSIDTNVNNRYGEYGTFPTTLVATTLEGCVSDTLLEVPVHPRPNSLFTVDDECVFEGTVFENESTIAEGTLIYEWMFGDENTSVDVSPIHAYQDDGFYPVQLIVESDLGCSDTLVKVVEIYPLPIVDAGADQDLSYGYTTELLGVTTANYEKAVWSPGEELSSPLTLITDARPLDTTTYTLTITSEFGCVNSDEMTVHVIEDFLLEPTNIITPNGDGKNDVWHIVNADAFEVVHINVFDRWGSTVYEATNYTDEWDGTVNFDRLPEGVYYYNIGFDASTIDYQGSITLLR